VLLEARQTNITKQQAVLKIFGYVFTAGEKTLLNVECLAYIEVQ
jgi:hypothetical protein